MIYSGHVASHFHFENQDYSLIGQETLAFLSRTLKLNPTYKYPYEHEALGTDVMQTMRT